ncbi:MAG: DUF4434 domain-containing protein [Syntrophobacteraceae bacterium]|nr:DUF4434 domain-containing protein [Syntrophobacteraceae bacterium]
MKKQVAHRCFNRESFFKELPPVVSRLHLLLVLLSPALLIPTAVCSFAKATPPIRGTFLQLSAQHQSWPLEKWQRLFADLQTIQVEEIVIQWTVFDDLVWYRTEQSQPATLDYIMQLAAASGIKVWLGLVHDSQFWSQIDRELALVEVYLRRLQLRSEEAARKLAAAYPQFYGWYIPSEVDDKHWQQHNSQEVLFNHLQQLTAGLRRIRAGTPVAISGFSNALMDPETLEHFWKNLVCRTTIDVVLFQDGIGTKKMNFYTLPLYLQAMQRGVQWQGCRLQVVVELFQEIQSRPFRAIPAPWERVAHQIALAQHYTDRHVIAFSIPDYMSPQAGEGAARLFQDYLAHWHDTPAKKRISRTTKGRSATGDE